MAPSKALEKANISLCTPITQSKIEVLPFLFFYSGFAFSNIPTFMTFWLNMVERAVINIVAVT